MANWEYTPAYGFVTKRHGPVTLVSRFEDGTETRRQKSSAVVRHFEQTHTVDKATADAMLDLFHSWGLSTTFTMITWDPRAATPSTDEATVRFESEPVLTQVSASLYQLRCNMIEVL